MVYELRRYSSTTASTASLGSGADRCRLRRSDALVPRRSASVEIRAATTSPVSDPAWQEEHPVDKRQVTPPPAA